MSAEKKREKRMKGGGSKKYVGGCKLEDLKVGGVEKGRGMDDVMIWKF